GEYSERKFHRRRVFGRTRRIAQTRFFGEGLFGQYAAARNRNHGNFEFENREQQRFWILHRSSERAQRQSAGNLDTETNFGERRTLQQRRIERIRSQNIGRGRKNPATGARN